MSTGVETAFVGLRDPEPRPRDVFAFHRPESLASSMEKGASLRAQVQQLPVLNVDGLRMNHIDALRGLERSYADNKPRALVHITVGGGKTFVAVAGSCRLLRFGGATRTLFLVDRRNLGRQAYDEFTNYVLPDDGRKFGEVYNVQLLRSNTIDPAAAVVITTLQRLYSILRGESELDEELEDESLFEIERAADETPVEVVYNEKIPIELFDVIWIDEAHRSIYGKYGQVLEYLSSARSSRNARSATQPDSGRPHRGEPDARPRRPTHRRRRHPERQEGTPAPHRPARAPRDAAEQGWRTSVNQRAPRNEALTTSRSNRPRHSEAFSERLRSGRWGSSRRPSAWEPAAACRPVPPCAGKRLNDVPAPS